MSQLKVNSIVPVGGLPSGATGGGIIQTVQTIKNDSFSTTSSSYVDITGFSVTITPSSNSSKILIMSTCGISADGTSDVHHMNLVRGSTNIAQPASTTTFGSTATNYLQTTDAMDTWSFNFIDSPSTTSATTYKWQLKTNLGTVRINNREHSSSADMARVGTIIAMEITG